MALMRWSGRSWAWQYLRCLFDNAAVFMLLDQIVVHVQEDDPFRRQIVQALRCLRAAPVTSRRPFARPLLIQRNLVMSIFEPYLLRLRTLHSLNWQVVILHRRLGNDYQIDMTLVIQDNPMLPTCQRCGAITPSLCPTCMLENSFSCGECERICGVSYTCNDATAQSFEQSQFSNRATKELQALPRKSEHQREHDESSYSSTP